MKLNKSKMLIKDLRINAQDKELQFKNQVSIIQEAVCKIFENQLDSITADLVREEVVEKGHSLEKLIENIAVLSKGKNHVREVIIWIPKTEFSNSAYYGKIKHMANSWAQDKLRSVGLKNVEPTIGTPTLNLQTNTIIPSVGTPRITHLSVNCQLVSDKKKPENSLKDKITNLMFHYNQVPIKMSSNMHMSGELLKKLIEVVGINAEKSILKDVGTPSIIVEQTPQAVRSRVKTL